MAKAGRKVKAYVGVTASNSTTYTWLTGEQSNSLNKTQAQLEVTDKSSAWQKFEAGIKGATAEITIFVDNTDTQQKALLNSLHNGAKVPIFIGELESNAPSDGDTFLALVTAISDTNEVGGVATRTVSLVADGEVTHLPALS